MVKFKKNGLLIITDSEGNCHVIEGTRSLLEAAHYIWEKESLDAYRMDDDEPLPECESMLLADLSDEHPHRLRDISDLKEDKYFQE